MAKLQGQRSWIAYIVFFFAGTVVGLLIAFAIVNKPWAELGEYPEVPEEQGAASEVTAASNGVLCPPGGWRHYGAYEGPCDVCGLTAEEVTAAVQMRHDCSRTAYRNGTWGQTHEIWKAPKSDEPICVMLCGAHIPCRSRRCLLGVHVRPGSSDAITFDGIFGKGKMSFRANIPNVTSVLDAGANVGAAALYFAIRYPQATVVAVEPSSSNYQVLLRNVRPFRNIVTIRAALWSNMTELCLSQKTLRDVRVGRVIRKVPVKPEFGYMASPCAQMPDDVTLVASDVTVVGRMQGIGVQDLQGFFDVPYFDILKIDIEGSECQIFANTSDLSFLERPKFAILELHPYAFKGATSITDAAFASMPRWRKIGKLDEHTMYIATD